MDDESLTPEEIMAWNEITTHLIDLREDMRSIYMKDLGDRINLTPDEKLVIVELELELQEARDAFKAWWDWEAGDENAWEDLEGVFSQLIDAIGAVLDFIENEEDEE